MDSENNDATDHGLPTDAVPMKRLGSWEIQFSKTTLSLYISATDYHAGPLKMSKEDLSQLTEIIDNETKKLEQEVVANLESHLESIIEDDEGKEIFRGAKIKLILPEK